MDKHGKKYTYDVYGNKQPVDDSLSPITEEEEDETPPPPALKLTKSLSDEERKEQLDKIKHISQEYKQGIEMIKEHITPEKQPPSEYEIDTSEFPKDPSYFDKKLNKEVFTSYRGTKY